MIKRQTYFSSTHSLLIIYMLRKSMLHITFLLSDRLERVCSQHASKRLSIFHAGKFSLSLHEKPCYYIFNTGLLKTKMSFAYMFYISTCFFKKNCISATYSQWNFVFCGHPHRAHLYYHFHPFHRHYHLLCSCRRSKSSDDGGSNHRGGVNDPKYHESQAQGGGGAYGGNALYEGY